jgi:hypothetical protein
MYFISVVFRTKILQLFISNQNYLIFAIEIISENTPAAVTLAPAP